MIRCKVYAESFPLVSWMHGMRSLALVLWLIGCLSCVSTCPSPVPKCSDVCFAARVATAEVMRRGWSAAVIDGVRRVDDHWVISLSHVPVLLGGHATIGVAMDGTVLSYDAGR